MSSIDETLAERGQRYGEFTEHADITQSIKDAMVNSNNWYNLDNDMKECLEMVAHKIGRILNGDPDYIDSWTDIIGYTRLVEKRLIAEQESAKALMQEGEAAKQMPLFGTRRATADEEARIEELLKGFNPAVGTLSDRNLDFQELKNREARATLDARVKAHIDAEQAANAGKKCDCVNCQTVRAIADLLGDKPAPNVMDLERHREAKDKAERAEFGKRMSEIEDKVRDAMRVVNSGFRVG